MVISNFPTFVIFSTDPSLKVLSVSTEFNYLITTY